MRDVKDGRVGNLCPADTIGSIVLVCGVIIDGRGVPSMYNVSVGMATTILA